MTDFVSVIQNVGFPIAVAAFVLIRLNGKVEKLANAMIDLTDTMRQYVDHAEAAAAHLSELNEEAASSKTLRDDARATASAQRIIDAMREGKRRR